jgi:hypothetical protein
MPRTKVQTEIVKASTDFHNRVPNPLLPISDFVLDNTITFDATNGVFDADTEG